MIGRAFKPLLFRPTTSHSKRKNVNVPRDETASLIEDFRKLDIGQKSQHKDKTSNVRKVKPPIKCHFLWPIIQYRSYMTRALKKTNRGLDLDHLNSRGLIQEAILEGRKAFLEKYDLLQDKIEFKGRIVYANRHLYDLHQVDETGMTNLMRMRLGMCPYSRDNKELIVIHHFDQTNSGPWVVLNDSFHVLNDEHLHSNVSLILGVNRSEFKRLRRQYWCFEAAQYEMNPLNILKKRIK